MKLARLLEALPQKQVLSAANLEIESLSYDSRRTQPGSLFVAVPGFHADGHAFIEAALKAGAVAVVAQQDRLPQGLVAPVPLIIVPNSRQALARLAAAFYGYPARRLGVVGVTGTDGKTTTCFLIEAVLRAAGHRTGLIGTVDFRVGERVWHNDSRQTTPEAPEIQQLLAEMVSEGVGFAVIESTSHGLALERVSGCEYDLGVFTNLSREHLDFHRTREQYLRDKGRLFRMLDEAVDKGIPKRAILNADDPAAEYLGRLSSAPVVSFGVDNQATIVAQEVQLSPWGASFRLVAPEGAIPLTIQLPGAFNVANALAAAAVGYALDIDLAQVREGLEAVAGVPGRMERIDAGQPYTVIVDYAHTPGSLEKVLTMLRPLTRGRLMVVFGCAGERDREKRPRMGRIAAELADFFVLTDEDPRLEDSEAILDEIEAGVGGLRQPGQDYLKIPDRRQAIGEAFSRARPGDLVLLAGKGHEQCIIVGQERIPWDDRRVARELIAEQIGAA